jgi:hypothetical protein
MALIIANNAISVSGLGAGTYGPIVIGGSNLQQWTLTAIGGSSGTVQLKTAPGGAVLATLNSPGTMSVFLQPGRYNLVLGGSTVPTNVALFQSDHGAHLEYPNQGAATAHAAELNNALQAGDTDPHIVVKGSVAGDLWLVNRGSKLTRVNPFAPVSARTLQE